MRIASTLFFTLAYLSSAQAWSACAPIKMAFVDQHRPPYYIGNGRDVAAQPGAIIELMHEIAASANCTVTLTRMPMLRLRNALEANAIDALPLAAEETDFARFAFPLDKTGKPDQSRAMRIATMLFVRASDNIARDADPAQVMAGKRVGVVHGSAIAKRLRDSGVVVDDGATTSPRNLEKLRLGRIDVFAVALVDADDLDARVAARFGKDLVRLDKPVLTLHLWVPVSKAYYANNREEVDTMWKWIGMNGNARFSELMRKYQTFQ